MTEQPFHYIALIDRERMGQTLFLKAMAKGMQQHKKARGILVHGDNARTEQLLQTGVPRPEARLRVTRENNRRLSDLLAEAGVGSVAMNAWQLGNYDGRYTARRDMGTLIPPRTHLVLSNQVTRDGDAIPLADLAASLATSLGILTTLVFSTREADAIFVQTPGTPRQEGVPEEFRLSAWPIQTWSMSDWSQADRILRN